MNTQISTNQDTRTSPAGNTRDRLLAGLPVTERRIQCSGISTALLEGGEGKPVILLHGPGESAVWWMRVIPRLTKSNRVIVPDLPGHGSSDSDDALNEERIINWTRELTEYVSGKPVIVGHLLGGSIAARFAVRHSAMIDSLVLVNSFGLDKFRPAPSFAYRLIRFMVRPTKKNYQRFLPHCMFDMDSLKKQMGNTWELFLEYNLECARNPEQKNALKVLMKEVGVPVIPQEDLDGLNLPVTLIWGRHDRANKLDIAEAASKRYDWPLHIIEEARDDPKLEQPDAFVNALLGCMEA